MKWTSGLARVAGHRGMPGDRWRRGRRPSAADAAHGRPGHRNGHRLRPRPRRRQRVHPVLRRQERHAPPRRDRMGGRGAGHRPGPGQPQRRLDRGRAELRPPRASRIPGRARLPAHPEPSSSRPRPASGKPPPSPTAPPPRSSTASWSRCSTAGRPFLPVFRALRRPPRLPHRWTQIGLASRPHNARLV